MDLNYDNVGLVGGPEMVSLPRNTMQRYQKLLDLITPYKLPRWIVTFILMFYIVYRVVHYQKWHFILYLLGIHLIGETVRFFTPLVYPEINENDSKNGPTLPISNNEEFKPFVRQLSEFKYWYSSTVATLLATFLSFFEFFHIPIFWPLLVIYYLVYLAVVMREEIGNMIKYKYLPWTTGKVRYRVT